MTEKTRIVGDLGETALLLPDLLNQGLLANDRAKYYFSLLQTAKARADHPEAPAGTLSAERQASRVDDPVLDTVVDRSERDRDGLYRIPEAARIVQAILDSVRAMIAPLQAAASAGLERATDDSAGFAHRLAALAEALPPLAGDGIPGGTIGAVTSGAREAGDSLHLLVMDLHKALNRLQTRIAGTVIDGAAAYRIDEADRPLIAAFMRGLNRTAPLKFGHPGLGTTATRAGGRLLIENDIGVTDAHVLVVAVEGLTATVTYTDIHLQRLRFFASLSAPFAVAWQDATARNAADLEDGTYYLGTGVFTAADPATLEQYLCHLGSRIVFLIDWNKARKQLGAFVRNADAVALLKRAAEAEVGHRAFLVLGGEHLVFEAVGYAAKARLPYGERLSETLGRDRAVAYLDFVLRTCAEGLLAGRSERLIRDEVKAELLSYFDTAQQSLIAVAARHAVFIFELASGVRDGLLGAPPGDSAEGFRAAAARAAGWERKADLLVNEARSMVRRAAGTELFKQLLEEADDAADGLEEAAFLLTLLPARPLAESLLPPLQRLGELLVEGAQEYVKALESAAHVHRAGDRADLDDFLQAVDRIVAVEHATDIAVRDVTAAVVQAAADFRELHLCSELARTLEEASDALSRSALILREYVLDEVISA